MNPLPPHDPDPALHANLRPSPVDSSSDGPTTGQLLQWLALVHVAVGVVFFRDELRSIARDGVVAGVPYRGPKATAFWFFIPSPPLWLAGRLLSTAEAVGDKEALRTADRLGVVSALTAIVLMPVSGFWGWLIISLRGLRRARRMR